MDINELYAMAWNALVIAMNGIDGHSALSMFKYMHHIGIAIDIDCLDCMEVDIWDYGIMKIKLVIGDLPFKDESVKVPFKDSNEIAWRLQRYWESLGALHTERQEKRLSHDR